MIRSLKVAVTIVGLSARVELDFRTTVGGTVSVCVVLYYYLFVVCVSCDRDTVIFELLVSLLVSLLVLLLVSLLVS